MVTKDEVKHLAWLARIEIDESSLPTYTDQIEKIIEYFDTLDKVTLDDTELSQRTSSYDKFREDVAKPAEDDVFTVVKNRRERFVKAPKMV